MRRSRFTALLIFILLAIPGFLSAQENAIAKACFKWINEARKDPEQFLIAHQDELTGQTKFINLLKRSTKMEQVVWDKDLEADCRLRLQGTLDPEYKGSNQTCGFASGMKGASNTVKPMDFILDFYTNVLDPNCRYLGIAFNAQNNTYWASWGYGCEMVNAEYTYTGKVDSSKVDFNKLNTAKSTSYLNALEKRMVLEVNFVRAYPKVYAQIIAVYLSEQANSYSGLAHDDYIAGMELIDELNTMEPMSILQPMQCVYEAAKAHGMDCAKRGLLDHTGSDGSHPWDRILKRCSELSRGNENLQGSGRSTPRYAVIQLLIDSGISSRGHRYNMLDRGWNYIGCYQFNSTHPKLKTSSNWVQNFGS